MSFHLLQYKSVQGMMQDLANPTLVDVQTIKRNNKHEIFYLFKSKVYPGDKVICQYTKDNNFYYFVDPNSDLKPFKSINDLKLIVGNYDQLKFQSIQANTYEKDLTAATRHIIDFYRKYPDNTLSESLKIMYVDIELDSSQMDTMPTDKKPFAPIVMISYAVNDKEIKTISLKSKRINYNNEKLKNTLFVNNETQLIKEFIKDLHNEAPDILTAWNASFDFGYITSRMAIINMDPRMLSPINYVECNGYYIQWAGFVILDMLTLYKNFTTHTMESYKLDDVSEYELGEKKLEYEGDIITLWHRDPENMIIYNIQDVRLLQRLNDKLKHIQLQNEIREFSQLDWNKSSSTIGVLDGLLIKYARKFNEAVRSKVSLPGSTEKIRGAYVMQPKGGLYRWCIDLDYSSLYPSIIRTFNIGIDTFVGKVPESIAFNYLYNGILPDNIDITYNLYEFNSHKETITKDEFKKLIDKYYLTITGSLYRKHNDRKSLYYVILTDLINKRKVYKKKRHENKIFDIKQLSMKVLANSLYGATKNTYFRFLNIAVAETITVVGRELIKLSSLTVDKALNDAKNDINNINTKEIFNYAYDKFKSQFYDKNIDTENVFYCDTDSMFINLENFVTDGNEEKEIIDKWAPLCEKIVNEDLIGHLKEKRYFQECYLDVKQEWIAKTLYMTGTKKKYALWIINEDKIPIDKIKYMGIEIKRSDVPKFIRNKLSILIESILKDKMTLQEIMDYVENSRIEIMQRIRNFDVSLGKSVSFSKPESTYKNMPQHIKSMFLWNALMGEHFKFGTRGKLFPITGFVNITPKNMKLLESLGKYNAIVIPNSLDKVPSNFVLDANRIIDTYWDKMIDRTLSPILSVNTMQMDTF